MKFTQAARSSNAAEVFDEADLLRNVTKYLVTWGLAKDETAEVVRILEVKNTSVRGIITEPLEKPEWQPLQGLARQQVELGGSTDLLPEDDEKDLHGEQVRFVVCRHGQTAQLHKAFGCHIVRDLGFC